MTNTHRELAHRIIELDIDNILDELHDRNLDDYATMIEPHLNALHALALARHDIACTDHTLLDLTNYDDLDHLSFDIDPDTIPCLNESLAAISALAYSFYRD